MLCPSNTINATSRKDASAKDSEPPTNIIGPVKLSSIACGKNHTVAVEAGRSGPSTRRVFTWGAGNYGCLGHRAQKDSYLPRLVSTLEGPQFGPGSAPVSCAAGATCTVVVTEQGHGYYWGKVRDRVGERGGKRTPK